VAAFSHPEFLMRALVFAFVLAACSPAAPPAEPQAEAPAPAAEAATNDPASNLAQMPSWADARAANIDFRAVGQEPGWLLDMYGEGDGKIVLLWDYGEHLQRFPDANVSFPRQGGSHVETEADGHTLVVNTRQEPCQDAMSGEAYTYTVEVVIDGRALNGCGRQL
jgi:putative lipoprotein